MSDKIQKFVNMLSSNKELAYDVETGGLVPGDMTPLDWKRGYVCGYSLSDGQDKVYIPVRHEGGGNIECVNEFEQTVSKIIEGRTAPLIGHNIKFDYHFSQNHGIKLGNKIIDTMVTEALINENRNSYSLENVCRNYPITPKKGKILNNHIAQKFNLRTVKGAMGHFYRLPGDDPLAVEYAEGDTQTTFELYQEQKKKIEDQDLDRIHDIESKLTYVLQKMERRGVLVDEEELERVKQEIDTLHYEAYAALPMTEDLEPINPKSNKDLQKYFEYCEIFDWPLNPPTERFPLGSPSFNKDFLSQHEAGLVIINARKYAHFKSMFLESFPAHVYMGKIHCRYNQAIGEFGGAKPGRLSCADPNMQFVPKRDKSLGKIFRKIFAAKQGYVIVELDYSQAEPRLFSHYSNEPVLINGYNSEPFIDMHSIAAEYMHITRDIAKNLNLGIMYTMGAEKLASKLGISIDEAKAIVRKWHRTFPLVSSFTKKAEQRARQRGWVMTVLGRRARFTDERYTYRAANRIVQGGSADILKYKMVEIDNYLESEGLEDEIEMLLTIHDSLVFQIREDRAEQHIETIKRIMEDVQSEPFNLRVPFVAEYKSGKDWSEATYGP